MSAPHAAVDVLIVEDDPDDRVLITRALSSTHPALTCREAIDGAECLQMLADGLSPRLILLDLNMPKVNGLEVIHQLRQHDDVRRGAIVILTTHASSDDHDALIASGIIAYVRKPDRYGELVALFRTQLDAWLADTQVRYP